MNHKKTVGGAAWALAIASLAACSGGGGDSPIEKSRLSVSLMDAPVDGVTAVYVKITSMWIKPLVACVWRGENRLWSSRPMLEATGSGFPFTKMSTCEW